MNLFILFAATLFTNSYPLSWPVCVEIVDEVSKSSWIFFEQIFDFLLRFNVLSEMRLLTDQQINAIKINVLFISDYSKTTDSLIEENVLRQMINTRLILLVLFNIFFDW